MVPRARSLGLMDLLRRFSVDCGVQTFVLVFGQWRLQSQVKDSVVCLGLSIYHLQFLCALFNYLAYRVNPKWPNLPKTLG